VATKKPQTKTFGEKLLACYEDLAYLQKGGVNSHFKYKFVEESAVKRAVNETLRKHGLWLGMAQASFVGEPTPKEACASCYVEVTDGENIASGTGLGGGVDSGDKAPMKANAAALKYALTSAFLIATGDDPEADAATDKPKPAASRKASRKRESEEVTFDQVLERAENLSDVSELPAVKSEAAQFAQHPRFEELRDAVKASGKRLG